MKIAIFLFLMLMTCSTLFAYEVNVIKFTDEKFDPIHEAMDIFLYHISFEEYKRNPKVKDKQIATITLVFRLDEIGKDDDAVIELAKKEARKLGASVIIYVSGTEYKDTGQIASTTFRCMRDKYYDDFENNNKFIWEDIKVYKELETSVFFRKKQEHLPRCVFEDELLKNLGIEIEHKKIKEKEKTIYIDVKTRKRINDDEAQKMVDNYLIEKQISFYRENFELYKSEYDKIMQVMKKHPKSNLYFPKLDSKGNIDYEKMKNDLKL